MSTFVTSLFPKTLALGAALCVSTALIACSETATDAPAASSNAATGISITQARINPPMAGRDVAAGYFEGVSTGQDDRLIAARADFAASTEIHTHTMEDGVMKMREVDAVDFPGGEDVTFKRGGYHLMMFGAELPDGADTLDVTLSFEKSGDQVVTFKVGG